MSKYDIGILPDREAIWGIARTAKFGNLAGHTSPNFYVDSGHGNADDDSDGTDPNGPLATLQAAVDHAFLEEYSVIYVAGDVTESVVVAATAPDNVAIIGAGPTWQSPLWISDGAALPCLTLNAEGWLVEGLHITPPAGAAGILLNVDGAGLGANETVIQNNKFNGAWSGLYGIEFSGAPYNVHILNNWFVEMNNADPTLAWCIYVTASGWANPYMCAIVGNRFSDADNYIGSLAAARGFNASLFKNNVFEDGVLLTPATFLDLRGGSRGYNIVTGNFFGGAYTNAGGYYAHAATPNQCWMGNVAEATPATVADNGLTVAVPA